MSLDENDFLRIEKMMREQADFISEKIHKSISKSFVSKLDYLKDQAPLKVKIFGLYASGGIVTVGILLFEFFKK